MNDYPEDVTDCIDLAGIAIKKSELLLSDLIGEYSFAENPIADLSTANGEAQKLIWEYNRLAKFMDMAHDYVVEVSRILEYACELNELK